MDFIAHPPERRPRVATFLSPGCTCCTCCCCVHSVGGVAGAIYGSMRRGAPPPEAETAADVELKAAVRLTVRAYWLAFTLITTFSLFVATLSNWEELIIGPIIIAFFLPIGQLAASIATWIYLANRKPDRLRDCYRRLGRITLFAFLGAVAGILGTVLTFSFM